MRIGKIIINALALIAASLIWHDFKLRFDSGPAIVWVLLLAAVFGVINTFIKPIAKIASLPLNLLALGLVGFLVNAGMVLLLAFVVGQFQTNPYALRLATFPPNLSVDALVAAVIGSIVISLVSTVLAWFLPD
ncbi:MAG: putative rane protein [Chloroflexota bacterium]|jgi:putative membrane protein|nr:putative rane protein [Chloroflexota bacterium]